MDGSGIGAAVRRKEDFRFLTGTGTYTDDINRPGQLYAYILRSPHAHAEIAGIDTGKAKAAPGVVAVYHRRRYAGRAACPAAGWSNPRTARRWWSRRIPCWRKARCVIVGDPVAVVIADTREQAQGRGRAHRGRLQAAAGVSSRR